MFPRVSTCVSIKLFAGAAALLLCVSGGAPGIQASELEAEPAVVGKPQRVGRIGLPGLSDCSGMDASTLRHDLLWAVSDEGKPLYLFALGLDGKDRGRVAVRGAGNRDCEALDAFRWKGESFLLIAETGNNNGDQHRLTLYVLREPRMLGERFDDDSVADVALRIVFQYPGKPRDVEAVAVDTSTASVMLVTKRESHPLLFVLPLIPASDRPVLARKVGQIGHLPLRFDADPASPYAWNATRPTALDISPSGDRAVLLTYRDAYLYSRFAGQRWEDVLRNTGLPIYLPSPDDSPDLRQRESVCFGADGRGIFVTAEGSGAGLYRVEIK